MRQRARWRHLSEQHLRPGIVVVTVGALLLASCSIGSPTPTATPHATPTSLTLPSLPPLRTAIALPATGNAVKIDSVFLDIYAAYLQGGRPAAEQKARETGVLNQNNEVQVTLVLSDNNTEPVETKVRSIGGRVVGKTDMMLDVVIPLDALLAAANPSNNVMLDLAGLNNVREIKVTPQPQREGLDYPEGTTIDALQTLIRQLAEEGVAVTGADKWQEAGITGKGVKVGIIDGGFGGYEALLGSDLPQRVTFKSFRTDGQPGSDPHGTAVAEIVHAMAPDAEIFLCPINSDTGYVNAVRYLVDEIKVQVIQQSQGWHDTRGDGTGLRAEQVDYARSKGVFYVKSAGNEGDTHYSATFRPNANGRHQFTAGRDRIQVKGADNAVLLYLTWDAWTGDPVNYDLYLVDQSGMVVAASRNVQGPGKTPYEALYYEGQPGQRYAAVIQAVGQQPSVRLDLFGKNTDLEDVGEGLTPVSSISNPGDARGSFTVGAVNFKNDQLERYSSQGPTLDNRRKPDISAPARVTTTAYKGQPFAGTSASAPHVSGAAALVISAQPNATPAQVQAFLEQHAKDIEDPGADTKSGFGRLALGPVEGARTPVQAGGSPAPSARPSPGTSPSPGPSAVPVASAAPASPGTTVGSGAPPIKDPFTDPKSGLPNGGEGNYAGGRYVLTPNAANRAAWVSYAPTYAGMTAEVDVQITAPGGGMAGMIFWQRSNDDYYFYGITADGYYGLLRYQNGRWAAATAWTKHQAIQQGGQNRLRLQINGLKIEYSANGQSLGTIDAPMPGSGRFGLLAATFEQTGVVATFSNLEVTPAP